MIESLKDLEKLLKLCRKQGVTEITVTGANLKLGDAPIRHSTSESIEDQEDEINPFDEPLTNEELVMFANGGN